MPKIKSKPVKLSERNAASNGESSSTSSSSISQPNKGKPSKAASKKGSKVVFNAPPELDELLEDSEFYLPVKKNSASIKGAFYSLATFDLKLAEPFDCKVLLKVDELWLYVSKIPGRSFVYAEWLENGEDGKIKNAVLSRIDESIDLSFLSDNSGRRQMTIILDLFDDPSTMTLKFVYLESAMLSGENPSELEGFGSAKIQNIMHKFYNIEIPRTKFTMKVKESVEHLDLLYSQIKSFHEKSWDEDTLVDVQHPDLEVSLRPYQTNSVNWMLQREKLLLITPSSELHPLYEEVITPSGDVLFYNKYMGSFAKKKPLVKPLTPGGILADEMGLGKTVEVLACILANPRPMDIDRISIEEESASDDIVDEEAEKTTTISCTASTTPVTERDATIDSDTILNRRNKRFSRPATPPLKRERSLDHHSEEISDNASPHKEDDESTVPRKKVRFSDEFLVIPNVKAQPLLHANHENISAASLTSIIKPFDKPETLQLSEKELRAIANKAKRKAIEEEYEKQLAAFSAVKHLKSDRNRYAGLFEGSIEKRAMFECVCGKAGDIDVTFDDRKVKCVECGIVQHKDCVGFDTVKARKYVCPHCNVRQPKIASRATLIVSPSAISTQWIEEIKKIMGQKNLKVKFYEGVYKEGYNQPLRLADYDIVITSYEVLSKELDYVDLPHCNLADGRMFRNAKRYTSLPSPLVCIEWWRVCLDEAQMVECATSRSAEMALRLSSLHRWCVTGTPVQHSLQDLYGLIVFLGADPYCIDKWWDILIQGPFNIGNPAPLCNLVCPLMWRTAKFDVMDQINIPPQENALHWINFSPVEEHFYRQRHVECGKLVLESISRQSDLDARLQTIPKKELDKILRPLISLRQACCHPQAVKKFSNLHSKDKDKTITMQQLLTNLIRKSKVECEESIRMILSSLNGLAGLSILQERWAEAAGHYREALTLVNENKGKFKADKLQIIHTQRNLNELLESNHKDVTPNENEANLAKDAEELESNYLAKFTATIESAKQTLTPLTEKVDEVHSQLFLEEAWWSSVIAWVQRIGEHQEVIERVRQAIDGNAKKTPNETTKRKQIYKSLITIESFLLDKTDSLEKFRHQLLKSMKKLQTENSQTLVNEAVDCHLRTVITGEKKKKFRCKLCMVSDEFKEYERILFREVTTRDKYEHLELEDVRIFGQLQTIVWTAGDAERILKSLLSYAKLKNADKEWLSDGATHLKELEAQKKEFKHVRALWSQINDYISAVDELNMCRLRFRLRLENEPVIKNKPKKKEKGKPDLSSNLKNKVEHINVIEPHEIEPHCLKLTLERSEGERSFRRKQGQFQYLLNLERDDSASAGGENPEPCPICRKTLGTQWTVLQCGHCFCVDCLNELKRRRPPNKRNIGCPVCREDTALGEISYVNTKISPDQVKTEVEQPQASNSNTDDFPYIEDIESLKKIKKQSAKAGVIVQEIKKILKADPADKILIFSSWTDMLTILKEALTENDISCTQVQSGKKFQEAIQLFKDPLKKVTALLLPVSRGSKGLNLTEARHVFLVEPILNPASELQALGRIHRIGQDKKTVVHRFIVKGTIEERMHIVLKAHQGHTKVEDDPVTLRDLYNMFASQQEPNQSSAEEDDVMQV